MYICRNFQKIGNFYKNYEEKTTLKGYFHEHRKRVAPIKVHKVFFA